MARLFQRGAFFYVLEADRKVENPTVFHLRTLTVEQQAALEDKIRFIAHKPDRDDMELVMEQKRGVVAVEILKAGLTGWENFFDGETPVEFKKDVLESIACLHPDDRHELAEAIEEGNAVTGDQERQ